MGFSRQEYWSGVPLPSLMTNLDGILKSRDITLGQKGRYWAQEDVQNLVPIPQGRP